MSDDKPPSPKPQQKGWIDRINQLLTGEPQDREDLLEILVRGDLAGRLAGHVKQVAKGTETKAPIHRPY